MWGVAAYGLFMVLFQALIIRQITLSYYRRDDDFYRPTRRYYRPVPKVLPGETLDQVLGLTSIVDEESGKLLPGKTRANAVILILCRNSDISGIVHSIKQFEKVFNRRYLYPYVYLNDVPFTGEFKERVKQLSKATVEFGLIPHEHWSIPPWIDNAKVHRTLHSMKKVIYGSLLSYRHMCRFNSGFFYHHPLVQGYTWYWRVEPEVNFYTYLPYDPFKWMEQNDKIYGFTIMMKEFKLTVPSLWASTRQYFVGEGKKDVHPDAAFRMLLGSYKSTPANDSMPPSVLLETPAGANYNLCHFWSNFEIARFDFYRSPAYEHFFSHLDRKGLGFFYERWGDAPVHTLALAFLVSAEKLHFFEDIGYFHPGGRNCPVTDEGQLMMVADGGGKDFVNPR